MTLVVAPPLRIRLFRQRGLAPRGACASMNRLWPPLLPDPRRFPAAQREAALDAARCTTLDVIERPRSAPCEGGGVLQRLWPRRWSWGCALAPEFALMLALPFVVAITGLVADALSRST